MNKKGIIWIYFRNFTFMYLLRYDKQQNSSHGVVEENLEQLSKRFALDAFFVRKCIFRVVKWDVGLETH